VSTYYAGERRPGGPGQFPDHARGPGRAGAGVGVAPVQRVAGITSRLGQVRALLAVDLFRNSREAVQLTTDITDFTTDTTARALPPGDL
jgi:hypothetical protein